MVSARYFWCKNNPTLGSKVIRRGQLKLKLLLAANSYGTVGSELSWNPILLGKKSKKLDWFGVETVFLNRGSPPFEGVSFYMSYRLKPKKWWQEVINLSYDWDPSHLC